MTDDYPESMPVRFVARSVDTDPWESWREGDLYDGYVPCDPDATLAIRPSGKRWTVNPHEMPLPDDWESWRVDARTFCTCGKPVVRVLVAPDGQRWAFIRPERIAPAARRPGHLLDELAAPLHADPHGVPHLEVSTCRCGRYWLIALYDDRADKCEVKPVRHGSRVSP